MFESVVALLQKVCIKECMQKEGINQQNFQYTYSNQWMQITSHISYGEDSQYHYSHLVPFQRARQFMRLGKFLLQYQEAVRLITQDNRDEFGRLVSIILHAFFSFYWALDNLSLAAAYGVLNIPEYEFSQPAMTVKFLGMSIAAFYNIRTWLRLHHQQLQVRKQLKYLKGEQNLVKERQLIDLVMKQWKMVLLCIKIYGDMLPTIGRSEWARRVLGIKIPRIAQALGGLVNALVSCLIAAN